MMCLIYHADKQWNRDNKETFARWNLEVSIPVRKSFGGNLILHNNCINFYTILNTCNNQWNILKLIIDKKKIKKTLLKL